jgi:signal transduction histidine kinase
LSIVKQLVTQLNGTLTVASQAGWTTFTLRLPLSGSMVENDRAIVPS